MVVPPSEKKPIDPSAVGGVAQIYPSAVGGVARTSVPQLMKTAEPAAAMAATASTTPDYRVLIGLKVVDRNREPLGEVRSVQLDYSGRVTNLLIDVGGTIRTLRTDSLSYEESRDSFVLVAAESKATILGKPH
jgi:hypothetical protein